MLPRMLKHLIGAGSDSSGSMARRSFEPRGEALPRKTLAFLIFYPQKLYPDHKSVLECTEEPFDVGFGPSKAQDVSIFHTF